MRGALSVRINDGTTDRHVTQYVRGLKFRKTAPGGYVAGSMKLLLPRSAFTDLGPNDKAYVYDARTAATLFEGYTENPGITDGPTGQEYDVSIQGTSILAADRSEKLIYRDTALDKWRRADDLPALVASSTSEVAEDPVAGVAALRNQFNPGSPVLIGGRASVMYDAFRGTGQLAAGIYVYIRGGVTDAGYRVDVSTAAEHALQLSLRTLPAAGDYFQGADWTSLSNAFYLHLVRVGATTNVTTDNVWAAMSDVVVVGSRVTMQGTPLALTDTTLVASDVVADAVGRLMASQIDPTLSSVTATTTGIDQLAYHDGATVAQVLDDLALWEPDYLWEILHSTHRGVLFRYRPWPATVRYEISVRDGYEAPGGETDQCNRIAVYWTDTKGDKRTTVVGAHVPELGNKNPVLPDGSIDPTFDGRIRDAEAFPLPDGQGSAANALRIGQQTLVAKASPPKAGKATIRRPILDRLTGNTVMPWEIEPGYLARVRETNDVLRLTEMEYDDDPVATTLTLGTPILTDQQRIARLERTRR